MTERNLVYWKSSLILLQAEQQCMHFYESFSYHKYTCSYVKSQNKVTILTKEMEKISRISTWRFSSPRPLDLGACVLLRSLKLHGMQSFVNMQIDGWTRPACLRTHIYLLKPCLHVKTITRSLSFGASRVI